MSSKKKWSANIGWKMGDTDSMSSKVFLNWSGKSLNFVDLVNNGWLKGWVVVTLGVKLAMIDPWFHSGRAHPNLLYCQQWIDIEHIWDAPLWFRLTEKRGSDSCGRRSSKRTTASREGSLSLKCICASAPSVRAPSSQRRLLLIVRARAKRTKRTWLLRLVLLVGRTTE